MDKKKVRKWVKALESGKYKQCKGVLYIPYPDRYCCLGVACAALLGNSSPLGCTLTGSLYRAALAEDLFDDIKQGVSSSTSKTEKKLMGLNDAGKKDFFYIARWIRKNILGEDVIIDVDAYNRRNKNKKGTK